MSADIVIDARTRDAILWQYETAEKLIGIVDIMQAGYDVRARNFWQDWYRDVFHVDTANNFGLSVWAKIFRIKLDVAFEAQLSKTAFGFGSLRRNFSPHTNFGSRNGGNVALTIEQKRMIIRARYFELTNRPTLDNINRFLKRYFWKDASKVYVTDPQDMSVVMYTFNYTPDGELSFLLENADILPRPACVGVGVRIIGKKSFGFGQYRANFKAPSNFGVIGA